MLQMQHSFYFSLISDISSDGYYAASHKIGKPPYNEDEDGFPFESGFFRLSSQDIFSCRRHRRLAHQGYLKYLRHFNFFFFLSHNYTFFRLCKAALRRCALFKVLYK